MYAVDVAPEQPQVTDLVEKEKELRKNRDFTQVYPKGWKRIIDLSKVNRGAASLYIFFAQHIDAASGAVVCDQQFLADQFGVNRSTISRWLSYLESVGAIIRVPVAGRVCAYALDPYEVWKGYNVGKDYAVFNTKTLVSSATEIARKFRSAFQPKISE